MNVRQEIFFMGLIVCGILFKKTILIAKILTQIREKNINYSLQGHLISICISLNIKKNNL